MLTKNKIKFIKSLQQKKHRTEAGSFVVEGRKGIEALIDSQFEVEELQSTMSYQLGYQENIVPPVNYNELYYPKRIKSHNSNKECV